MKYENKEFSLLFDTKVRNRALLKLLYLMNGRFYPMKCSFELINDIFHLNLY